MIKTQENFDSYSLSNLYNILKAHEAEVKEIANVKDKANFGGPLALIYKTNIHECSSNKDDDNEEGMIVNSKDEVVTYYSKNNVKNIYKKPIKWNFKSNTFKKVALTWNTIVKNKKDGNVSKKKVYKYFVGDSSYECNYCKCKNHVVRDCMLKSKEEKKEKVKDEA